MGMNGLIFVVVFVFTAVVFAMGLRYRVRMMEHKENLAALEKGATIPVRQEAPWTPRAYLLQGMIWLFSGLAAMFAIIAIAVTSVHAPSIQEKMNSVSVARANNATPEEIQMLLKDTRAVDPVPIGLAFLGLIPVAVGAAYLIFYRIESKKLLN